MRTYFLLLLLLQASGQVLIPVTDPALTFSRYTWDVNPLNASASNPGASLKFSFSNSTSVSLQLDTSTLTPKPCLLLVFSVDDGPWVFVTPTPGNATLNLPLATGLSISSPHDVKVYLSASCESGGSRWHKLPAAAGGNTFLVISGVVLGVGGEVSPPPMLRPNSMLIFGDSISEGTNANNYDLAAGHCGGPYGLGVSSSTDSWAFSFAEALGAEPSLAAFAAQGFVTRNSFNYGGVPPLLTPGSEEDTAWDKVNGNASRLPALSSTPPTYLVSGMGFNDQNSDVQPSVLTSVVGAWLAAARSAVGPSTNILLVLPFGGELRTHNATRGAIMEGFAAYKGAPGGGGDGCVFLLDLLSQFPGSALGLEGLGAPTAQSCDGTHPLARAHARIGAMLGALAVSQLAGGAPHCLR
jgi:hypothetical protein